MACSCSGVRSPLSTRLGAACASCADGIVAAAVGDFSPDEHAAVNTSIAAASSKKFEAVRACALDCNISNLQARERAKTLRLSTCRRKIPARPAKAVMLGHPFGPIRPANAQLYSALGTLRRNPPRSAQEPPCHLLEPLVVLALGLGENDLDVRPQARFAPIVPGRTFGELRFVDAHSFEQRARRGALYPGSSRAGRSECRRGISPSASSLRNARDMSVRRVGSHEVDVPADDRQRGGVREQLLVETEQGKCVVGLPGSRCGRRPS